MSTNNTKPEGKEQLREQFSKESGFHWINSQGEPDIDYVDWLESRLLSPSDHTAPQGEEELPTRDYLKSLGFKELPHPTVMNSIDFDLGRNRRLSIGCLGTPNEMIFICQHNSEDFRKVDDLVCLHNWDYDGYLTKGKINALLSALTTQKKQPLTKLSEGSDK